MAGYAILQSNFAGDARPGGDHYDANAATLANGRTEALFKLRLK